MSAHQVSRRSFMSRAIPGIAAVIGLAVAVPLAGFDILPVTRIREQ